MKINYKKMNTGLDVFYTLGLSIIFIIAGFYIDSIAYSAVSIGYGVWVGYLWIKELTNKVRSKTSATTEDQSCDEDNKTATISTVCPV